MRAFQIQKASRWHELFRPEKIQRSLERAGAEPGLAAAVAERVARGIARSASTADIAERTSQELDRVDQRVAARYRLRRAIMELGPEGYPFERYVGKIFSHYGYSVKIGQHIPGRCISHEVDVDAEKDGRRLMLECKYHNRRGVQSDAKVALYTWARYEDIRDRPRSRGAGAQPLEVNDTPFTEGWLVTNTKVTRDALTFARCVGMSVLGWSEPPERPLQQLIEAAGLYPITCLPQLSAAQRRALLQHDVLLCRQIAGNADALQRLGLSQAAAIQLALDATQIAQPLSKVLPSL